MPGWKRAVWVRNANSKTGSCGGRGREGDAEIGTLGESKVLMNLVLSKKGKSVAKCLSYMSNYEA